VKSPAPKKLPAVFFRTDSGAEPVREWLVGPELTNLDRRAVGIDIARTRKKDIER
jgi:hypothetical protein